MNRKEILLGVCHQLLTLWKKKTKEEFPKVAREEMFSSMDHKHKSVRYFDPIYSLVLYDAKVFMS